MIRRLMGRALMVVPALVVTGLIPTACSVAGPSDGYGPEPYQEGDIYYNDSNILENHFTLSDGREVTCLALVMSGVGGLSCDWDNASKP